MKFIKDQYWKFGYNLALFEYKRFRGLQSVRFTTKSSMDIFCNANNNDSSPEISIYKEMYHALTSKLVTPHKFEIL